MTQREPGNLNDDRKNGKVWKIVEVGYRSLEVLQCISGIETQLFINIKSEL